MISTNFIFTNFCVIFFLFFFLTKLLIFDISTSVRAVVVAKLVISGILPSIFFILALYTSFLTTSFLLHDLVYLHHQEQVLIYQHLIHLLCFSNCLNYLKYFSIFQFSILNFKLAKSTFLAKFDVSTPVTSFKSDFVT